MRTLVGLWYMGAFMLAQNRPCPCQVQADCIEQTDTFLHLKQLI